MFSPEQSALDLCEAVDFGRLLITPLQPGVWSLLEPVDVQNHAPQLCWLRHNCLACVWMAGGQEGTAGMSIHMSLLVRGSSRWTPPQRISKDPLRSEQNPLLFVSDGQLHLIHTAQCSRDSEDVSWQQHDSSFSMQWTALLRRQQLPLVNLEPEKSLTWAAEAWSSPEDLLGTPAFCRHPPHPLPRGHWLLPIYRSLEGRNFGADHSELLHLDASGRVQGEAIPVPDSVGRVHGSLVTAADGHGLLQLFRSRFADRVYRSCSHDQGSSWTAPTPLDLPNNNSSIQGLRLASGRLALIFNRFSFGPDPDAADGTPPWGEARWPRTRWPLSIALSEDDGDSWPWIRDIDTGFGFCGSMNWGLNGQLAYPSILEGHPGDLHLAYSWAGRQAIRYLCLTEQDILG